MKIPDEQKVGGIFEVGASESDKIGGREVVGDGEDEERSGTGGRVWKGSLGGLSIEVNDASPFAEFRVMVRWGSGCIELDFFSGGDGLLVVH